MEFYAENASPTEPSLGGNWTIFPRNRSKRAYQSMPAINNYYQSLLDVQPRPLRVPTTPELPPERNIVQLLDSAWWGAPMDNGPDSGTPSSHGSAEPYEPDFHYSYANLHAMDQARPDAPEQTGAVPGPVPGPVSQNQRVPRVPLRGSLRRNSSKRLPDSRDLSRRSSLVGNPSQDSEGPLTGERSITSGGLLRRLGTWAERVTLYVRSAPSEHHPSALKDAAEEEAGWAGGAGDEKEDAGSRLTTPSSSMPSARKSVRLADEPGPPPAVPDPDEDVDVEMVKKAAWRYRFTRRWQQEQAKQFDPDFGREGGDEEWDEALGYLKGVGAAVQQIHRTTSDMEAQGMFSNPPSLTPHLLLLPDSVRDNKAQAKVAPEATKALAAVARRAHDLAQKQAQIQQKIEHQWQKATAEGRSFADDVVPVEIDLEGEFPFVLACLTDGQSEQFLVRGHARTRSADLLHSINMEVASSRASKQEAGLRVVHLGTGTLRWNNRRSLEVVKATHSGARHPRVRDPQDVARCSGTLLSAQLTNCVIIVDGVRLS